MTENIQRLFQGKRANQQRELINKGSVTLTEKPDDFEFIKYDEKKTYNFTLPGRIYTDNDNSYMLAVSRSEYLEVPQSYVKSNVLGKDDEEQRELILQNAKLLQSKPVGYTFVKWDAKKRLGLNAFGRLYSNGRSYLLSVAKWEYLGFTCNNNSLVQYKPVEKPIEEEQEEKPKKTKKGKKTKKAKVEEDEDDEDDYDDD